MKHIDFHLGQPVYTAETDSIRLTATIQNACVMPYFRLADGKEICPYWIAPWWNDRLYDDGSTISSTLRGNFFCASREGELTPEHGWCANTTWTLDKVSDSERGVTMTLRCENDADGSSVVKTLRADMGGSAVYEADVMTGFDGLFHYNTHPCLKLPQTRYAGQLMGSFGKCVTCADVASPAEGSYRRLPSNYEIEDWHCVTTVYGEKTDLTRHPQRKGAIDLLLAKTETDGDIGYAVFVNPEEGYLYYQLKNINTLPYTMLWLFNGGRHFAPWNGTTDGCLGVEEISAKIPIFDGSCEEDAPSSRARLFVPEESFSVRQIYGAVSLPRGVIDMTGVEVLQNGLRVTADGADAIEIPIDLSFLKD